MKGTMMDYQLTLHSILERTPILYPGVEIVSRLPRGGIHCYAYKDFYLRATGFPRDAGLAQPRRFDNSGPLHGQERRWLVATNAA